MYFWALVVVVVHLLLLSFLLVGCRYCFSIAFLLSFSFLPFFSRSSFPGLSVINWFGLTCTCMYGMVTTEGNGKSLSKKERPKNEREASTHTHTHTHTLTHTHTNLDGWNNAGGGGCDGGDNDDDADSTN